MPTEISFTVDFCTSEIDTQVRHNFCYLICKSHVIRSRAVTIGFFFSEKTYFPSCVRSMYLATMVYKYNVQRGVPIRVGGYTPSTVLFYRCSIILLQTFLLKVQLLTTVCPRTLDPSYMGITI